MAFTKGHKINLGKHWKMSDKARKRISKLRKKQWAEGKGNGFKKGHKRFRTDESYKKFGENYRGKRNGMWKGEEASYYAKHIWINNRFGGPSKCEHCGTTEKKTYHWANISGKYLRERADWLRLCVPCHSKYDNSCRKL